MTDEVIRHKLLTFTSQERLQETIILKISVTSNSAPISVYFPIGLLFVKCNDYGYFVVLKIGAWQNGTHGPLD